ncbi:MAG: hypothetical protein ABH856_01830 [Patescibacteria group bacterium]
MKPPINEIFSKGSMMAMMDYIGPIELFADYGMSLQEIVEKNFNILPLKYLVNENIPYKDENSKEGWFSIKAMTISARCPFCNSKPDTPNFILIGYLKNKKFLGLVEETKGCISCPDCGSYTIYPKDLIEIILNDARNKNITKINNKSIDEILKEEKVKMKQSRKK